MKFCSKCGTQVEDDVKFCPNCGAGFEITEVSEVVESTFNGKKEPSWQRVASRIILNVSKVVAIIGVICFGIIIGVSFIGVIVASFEFSGGAIFSPAGVFGMLLLEFSLLLPVLIFALVFIGKTITLIDEGRKIPMWLKICNIIFVNVVPGIFLLTDSEDGYDD